MFATRMLRLRRVEVSAIGAAPLEHRVGYLRCEVAAELLRSADLPELLVDLLLEILVQVLELPVHLRELAARSVQVHREPTELVPVRHLDLLVEVAAGDPAEREIDLRIGRISDHDRTAPSADAIARLIPEKTTTAIRRKRWREASSPRPHPRLAANESISMFSSSSSSWEISCSAEMCRSSAESILPPSIQSEDLRTRLREPLVDLAHPVDARLNARAADRLDRVEILGERRLRDRDLVVPRVDPTW